MELYVCAVYDSSPRNWRAASHEELQNTMNSTPAITAIINPSASSGKVGARAGAILEELRSEGLTTRVLYTERPKHAIKLAAEASGTSDVVLAIGGDGTNHEVAMGLLASDSHSALAVLPTGTGNDFARMIGMSENPRQAARQLLSGVYQQVDVGRVSWFEESERRIGAFVNALGIGFDGYAAYLAPKYKGLPFKTGYLVTILAALKSWVPCGVTVWEETDGRRAVYSGRLFFVTVGNARDSAGGYQINPKASITDGLLDICLVRAVGYFRALHMLPSARTGSHLRFPEVSYWHSKAIRIESDRSLPVHADGEMLSVSARNIEVSVDPGALTVLVPSDA